MKQTINFYDFEQAFRNHNRFDQFGYDGLKALFDWLDTGVETDLDVIALCCDFSLYDSIEDFQDDYGDDYETMADIENKTLVIPVDDNAFIIQDF